MRVIIRFQSYNHAAVRRVRLSEMDTRLAVIEAVCQLGKGEWRKQTARDLLLPPQKKPSSRTELEAEWNRATPYDLRSIDYSAIKGGVASEPMEPLYHILRGYPELALFLTLAIGFSIGRLKIAGCSVGSVTGVLLTGLVIGQLDIPSPRRLNRCFFYSSFLRLGTE